MSASSAATRTIVPLDADEEAPSVSASTVPHFALLLDDEPAFDAPSVPPREDAPVVEVPEPAEPIDLVARLRRAGLVGEGEQVEVVTDAPPPVRERTPPRP